MDEQYRQLNENQIRLERKLELQEQKISFLTLNVSSRNEDLLQAIERQTPQKLFREELTHLRNYFENKLRVFQEQQDQLQVQVSKSLQHIKEEYTLQNQNSLEKVGRISKDVLAKLEQAERMIVVETTQQIETMVRKVGQMEAQMMGLFTQKGKLIEKLAICQENQNAKIHLFESALQSKGQTTTKKLVTPNHSARKLNFESNSEVPIDMLRRQEDVLLTVTQSIQNIERKLAETDLKKRKLEPSFDQYSLQWSQPKLEPNQQSQFESKQQSPFKAQYSTQQQQQQQQHINIQDSFQTIQQSSFKEQNDQPSLKLNLDPPSPMSQDTQLQNHANPLTKEEKSPIVKSNRDISKIPIIKKVSPKPLIASPSANIFDDIRMEKEYETKMLQLQQQNELQRQKKQQKQADLERQFNQMKNSQISNESSVKNDSYYQKGEAKDDFKKSQGGLRGLMQQSKERVSPQQKQPATKPKLQSQQSYSPQRPQLQPVTNTKAKSRTNQMKSALQQQMQMQNESSDEVVYQMDEEGYLMDEQGNYLLDEKGNYIQLSDKDLEELKRQNLVIEQ